MVSVLANFWIMIVADVLTRYFTETPSWPLHTVATFVFVIVVLLFIFLFYALLYLLNTDWLRYACHFVALNFREHVSVNGKRSCKQRHSNNISNNSHGHLQCECTACEWTLLFAFHFQDFVIRICWLNLAFVFAYKSRLVSMSPTTFSPNGGFALWCSCGWLKCLD